MTVKSQNELKTLREGGRKLGLILQKITASVRSGISTLELDRLAEGLILEQGGYPVFKGYRTRPEERPFPGSICTSLNDEVVHAIPRKTRRLYSGDILGLDIGMRWHAPLETGRHRRPPFRHWRNGSLTGPAPQGLITDMAVTVAVGEISPRAAELLRVTREALAKGIRVIRPGIQLGDLGHAIQSHIEESGFSVVRDLAGHGVGRSLHEDPLVPNYGLAGSGELIKEGMVLAIEPMATSGGSEVVLDKDGWAWRTKDGSWAAHFEHTVVVTKDGVEIITKV